jgi:hypothetical protein
MKKLIILLLLALPLTAYGQDIKVVETDIFVVGYSEALEQPVWVEYKVLCPNGQAERTGLDF